MPAPRTASIGRRLGQWASVPARLWRASWPDRLLLVETFACLGAARLAVRLVPFRWTSAWVARQSRDTGESAGPAAIGVAERIAALVPRVSAYTPWRSNCLAQGLAAHAMLRRRGVPSTLHLGLAKNGDDRLVAHAWLSCGTCIVTGAPGHERFTSVFAGGPSREPGA